MSAKFSETKEASTLPCNTQFPYRGAIILYQLTAKETENYEPRSETFLCGLINTQWLLKGA